MKPNINRALIFQGGGSLGAYEAGVYNAIKESLSEFFKKEGRENETLFHIVSGTSIGSINAAILVSYVKENKTWEGSGERLIEFWEYLSTRSWVDNIPNFVEYWDAWRKINSRVASGESARRYFSTKQFIFNGVPKVFVPKRPQSDDRFFDPSNTWYTYDNKPLKDSLERLFPNTDDRDSVWQQVSAVIAVYKRFCVISGGPGTGKTFTVAKVLALLLEN